MHFLLCYYAAQPRKLRKIVLQTFRKAYTCVDFEGTRHNIALSWFEQKNNISKDVSFCLKAE